MGWGCSAPMKRKMLFAASHHNMKDDDESALQDMFDAVVIDVNACFRNMIAPGGICQLTPRSAVAIFFKNYVSRYSNARTIVFAFDSPHLVPEERLTFHKTKRYAKATRSPEQDTEILAPDGRIYKRGLEPIEDTQVALLTPDHIPGGVWDRYVSCSMYSECRLVLTVMPRFWNSTEGKRRLWDIVQACLQDIIETWAPSKCYIIDSQDGRRMHFPPSFRDPLFENIPPYGEGDAKAIMYTLALKNTHDSILICTIDWDMAIQVYLLDV